MRCNSQMRGYASPPFRIFPESHNSSVVMLFGEPVKHAFIERETPDCILRSEKLHFVNVVGRWGSISLEDCDYLLTIHFKYMIAYGRAPIHRNGNNCKETRFLTQKVTLKPVRVNEDKSLVALIQTRFGTVLRASSNGLIVHTTPPRTGTVTSDFLFCIKKIQM